MWEHSEKYASQFSKRHEFAKSSTEWKYNLLQNIRLCDDVPCSSASLDFFSPEWFYNVIYENAQCGWVKIGFQVDGGFWDVKLSCWTPWVPNAIKQLWQKISRWSQVTHLYLYSLLRH